MADSETSAKQARGQFVIRGITSQGKAFRPSDWAERLCGVMARFRPEESGGPHPHLQYSPYVHPILHDGVKSVAVDERLRDIEPLAYHFVLGFAKDNDLQVVEAADP